MYTMTMTLVALLLGVETMAYAQTWQPPSDSQRCPSKWGAGDQRGSGNHMSRETVLRATKLIRTGEVFELGHVLNDSMPLSAGRRFEVLTKRTRYDDGSNHRGSNEELVVAEIGQVGTQFDTFSHQMIGNTMYNCFKLDDISTRTGFSKLGVELTLQPGDAVIIHTGWGQLWGKDNMRFRASAPGIGVTAAEWLARQDPMLVGSDNSAIEVSPNPNPQLAGPVHQIMLVVNGIHLLENMKLDEIAARRIYEFALILEPLKIQGGTGSTVAPIAIH